MPRIYEFACPICYEPNKMSENRRNMHVLPHPCNPVRPKVSLRKWYVSLTPVLVKR